MKSMLRKKYNPQQDCGKMLYRYEYFVFKINHIIMFYSGNRIKKMVKQRTKLIICLKDANMSSCENVRYKINSTGQVH